MMHALACHNNEESEDEMRVCFDVMANIEGQLIEEEEHDVEPFDNIAPGEPLSPISINANW